MKLHSPQLEKSIRRLARGECKRDRALARQWKSAPKSRLVRVLFGIGLFILLRVGLMFLVISACVTETGNPYTVAAAFGLWWLSTLVMGAGVVSHAAHYVPDALLMMPISRADIRRMLGHRIVLLMARPFADACTALLVIVTLTSPTVANHLLILPLSVLYAGLTWSASVWLAMVKLPSAVIVSPICIIVFLYFAQAVTNLGKALWLWFDAHAQHLVACIPGSWIPMCVLAVSGRADIRWFVALFPLMGVALSGFLAYRILCRNLDPVPALLWRMFGEAPDEWRERVDEFMVEAQQRAEKEAAEGADPFSAAEWSRRSVDKPDMGFIEVLFVRWLTPREKSVVEFAAASVPQWTKDLWLGVAFLAVGTGVSSYSVAHQFAFMTPLIVGPVLMVIGVLKASPISSGFSRVFAVVFSFGVSTGLLALFPVRLSEVAVVSCKAAVIRALAIMPFFACAGASLLLAGGASPWLGCWMGIKLALLMALSATWLLVLACSSRSNDTAKAGWRNLRIMALLVGSCILLLFLGVAAMFAPAPVDLYALAAYATATILSFLCYRRMYSRGWFDLVQSDRSTMT